MASDANPKDRRSGLAVGAGIVGGIITALVVVGAITLPNGDQQSVEAAVETAPAATELAEGVCVALNRETSVEINFVDCDEPHDAEITQTLEYTEDDTEFPGGPALSLWASQECEAAAAEYLGTDILDTSLAETMLVPTEEGWLAGDRQITCYVADLDDENLTTSVRQRGTDFPRDEVVSLGRLKVGDCYVPADDTGAYDLNSNSDVLIVGCDTPFAGLLFGRDTLDDGHEVPFPGEDPLKEESSDRCSVQFREHFNVNSTGFSYHYFRPSEPSWEANDRSVLCSILDENPIPGGFDATEFRPFFELGAGQCFNLGPEEDFDTIWLNDMVLPVDCSVEHAGEMIGAGLLNEDPTAEIPEEGLQVLAEGRCEQTYTTFMGFSPSGTEYDMFPFWYPNEADWQDGDRRFACAFVGPDLPLNSLQGLGQQ